MRKMIIPLMLLILLAPAFAYEKGDIYTTVSYDISDSIRLANGTTIEYTPKCLEECWLPIEMYYTGLLTPASKSLSAFDINYDMLKIGERTRDMDIEYYYVSYEYGVASTWTPDESCVLKNGTVSCGKGSWVNETKWGNFLKPLTEKMMDKGVSTTLVIKGTEDNPELGSSVDIIPEVFGFSMEELAVWDASIPYGGAFAHGTWSFGLNITLNYTQLNVSVIEKASGVGSEKCYILFAENKSFIKEAAFVGDNCTINAILNSSDTTLYMLAMNNTGNRLIYESASYPYTSAGFNITVSTNNNTGSWVNNPTNQIFNFQKIFYENYTPGAPATPTSITLLLNGTGSNATGTYGISSNATATINVTGLFAEIYHNGALIANGTNKAEDIDIWNVSLHNFTAYYPGNASFSSAIATYYWNITAATPTCSISAAPASPTGYGNQTNITCTCSNSDVSGSLYLNDVNTTSWLNNTLVILPVWNNTLVCNSSASMNYTVATSTETYNVTQANPALDITFNVTSPQEVGVVINVSCTFPAQVGAANTTLFNDTANISNPTYWNTAALSEGTYNYTCNSTAVQNYTAGTVSESFTLSNQTNILIIHRVYDERNTSANITFNVDIFNTTYSAQSSGITTYQNNEVRGDLTVVISSEGYGTRTYYITVPDDASYNMSGYLVNTSAGHTITFTVKNYYEQLLENVNLTFRRLLPTWTTVGEGRTDSAGISTFFADDEGNYNMTVELAGYTILEKIQTFPLSSYTIYLNSGTVEKPSFWSVYRNLASSCAFSNASRTVNCTWNDTSGHLDNITLEVRTVNSTGHMWMLCNNTSTSNNGTFYCNAGTLNNQTYIWSMWGDTSSDPTSILLESGTWTDLAASIVLGTTGLIIVLLFTMFSGFIGVQMGSPIITVIMTTLGVGFSYALGFLTLGTAAVSILIGLALSAGVMVWKMRSDEK